MKQKKLNDKNKTILHATLCQRLANRYIITIEHFHSKLTLWVFANKKRENMC